MTLSFSIHILPMDYGAITTGNQKEPAMGFQKFDDGNQYSNQPPFALIYGRCFFAFVSGSKSLYPAPLQASVQFLGHILKTGTAKQGKHIVCICQRFQRPHRHHECSNGGLLAGCTGCTTCSVGTSCQRFSQRLFLLFTQSRFGIYIASPARRALIASSSVPKVPR